jgi:vitamin B12 transporter
MVLFLMKTRFFRARCGAVAAFGALIFSFSVSAQDGAETVALQEVVVTASRFARPVKEVLADVTVIDRQQIEESGATTVLQLLETQPGLQVNFGDSKTGNIYVRGAEARMTGLLIDGVRMGGQDGLSRIGGGVPWETIPLGNVERIEIVRGPSSVSYGSDAMAGVVQIITRKGEAGVHPFVTMGVGSYNTQTLTAGIRGAQGDWDYAVHAGATRSDGFNTRPDVAHSPDTEGYKNSESGLSLGYQVDRANKLEVKASQNRLQSRYVGYYSSTFQDLVYPNDATVNTSMSSFVAAWEAQWTDTFKTATKWTNSSSRYQDDSFYYDYFTTLDGLSLDANWRALGGNITAYLESKADRLDQAADYYNSAINASRSSSSQGLGYGTKFGPHEVQMNLRSDYDSVFGVSNVGAAAYAYQIAPEWRASTSAGNSFRAPTLEQLYGAYGSTSLAPERGQSLDASLAFSKSGQELKLAVYRNVFDNLISTNSSFYYYNVNRASVEGVTLSGSKRFTGFRLHGSVDQINPRYEAGTYAGNYLIMRARQVINLGLETTLGEWTVGADVRDVGQTYDDAPNTAYKINPAYTLLNLRAQTEIAKDWTWSLRINNATDQSYKQSYTGMTYSAGCNFFTTLQWAPK